MTHSKGLKPSVQLRLNVDGKSYNATATGDGQYDSFMRAVKKIYKSLEKEYDYQTSEESYQETCDANEYEFYSDGSMV